MQCQERFPRPIPDALCRKTQFPPYLAAKLALASDIFLFSQLFATSLRGPRQGRNSVSTLTAYLDHARRFLIAHAAWPMRRTPLSCNVLSHALWCLHPARHLTGFAVPMSIFRATFDINLHSAARPRRALKRHKHQRFPCVACCAAGSSLLSGR